MAPRTDISEERREQILDAAATVFARLGVRESRMDDIVAQADLSKGGLYWYFKSKDDLVAAFIERLFARGIDNFKEFLKTDQPLRARLMAISHYVAADIRTRPRATASRSVSGFADTSTMRTRPRASRCVSFVMAGEDRALTTPAHDRNLPVDSLTPRRAAASPPI